MSTVRLQPQSTSPPVIRVVLAGTFVVIGLMMLILIASLLAGNHYVLPRLGGIVALFGYVGVSAYCYRRRHFRISAWMLLLLYMLLGVLILASWSINAPIGVLVLGFAILLAGIMLGARAIIPAMFGVALTLFAIQFATDMELLVPDPSSLDSPSTYLDVFSYCTIFILFAIVSWLAGRRNEQLLLASQSAEHDLQQERRLLRTRLAQRTREVREAQLEETRQMYRFAELGQLGTVLLHDLANNLTALTLDIDDLGRRLHRNESITRAKESIAYLETMVSGVRRQIQERDQPRLFDALAVTEETVESLAQKASRAGVVLEYIAVDASSFMVNGDPIRLGHALTILISNAIEACVSNDTYEPGRIGIHPVRVKGSLRVEVSDTGHGISHAQRSRLFEPFTSTKPNGMGIGLFMAREMVTRHFGGKLTVAARASDGFSTTFVLRLPKGRPSL